ncbi:MAG TPA: response regulator [Dongiaceae bacterium]|jgi:FixJ family two-component response regulator
MSARHRIAIVDDDHSVRKALCRLLRSADLDAHAYASGREFLDALRDAVPDCLVLDLRMPDMSGLELQRHLVGIGMAVPTIIMTGHDEPGLRADCLAAGARKYLRKPLDDRALLDAIEEAIMGAPSSRGRAP